MRKNIPIDLENHFEQFATNQPKHGPYEGVSEVIRKALIDGVESGWIEDLVQRNS
jgi:Arc/MetJ-type ribon-helix-helix transcriptional regulator